MQKYIYQWKNLNVAFSMSDHLWIFLKLSKTSIKSMLLLLFRVSFGIILKRNFVFWQMLKRNLNLIVVVIVKNRLFQDFEFKAWSIYGSLRDWGPLWSCTIVHWRLVQTSVIHCIKRSEIEHSLSGYILHVLNRPTLLCFTLSEQAFSKNFCNLQTKQSV